MNHINKKFLAALTPDNLMSFVLFALVIFVFHKDLTKMFFKNTVAFCSVFGLTFIFYIYIIFVGKKLKIKEDKSVRNTISFIILVLVMLIILYWPMLFFIKQLV